MQHRAGKGRRVGQLVGWGVLRITASHSRHGPPAPCAHAAVGDRPGPAGAYPRRRRYDNHPNSSPP
jgi:hypothetical protein